MKKITLLIVLFTYTVQSQNFPNPYCEITEANNISVEEITAVNFGTTSITNTNSASVLINKTSTIVNVSQEQILTLEVSGNTYGDFNTDIVAFIDWNQNNTLDDAGEIYQIGTITNSTGNDGVTVFLDVMVPVNAVLGNTRIRITKTYQDANSPAEIDPCGILFNPFGQGIFAGYGQALDFTLNVTSLSVNEFDINALTVYPIPTRNILNIEYKTDINTIEIYNLLGEKVYVKNSNTKNIKLNISNLSSGLYVVKLLANKGQYNFKIFKQ